MPYILREALRAFQRTPLLAGLSAGMIALSLFLVGLFGIAAYNIRRVLERVESRVEIIAYLQDDAIPELVLDAQEQIRAYPEVREVIYISKPAALIKARRELPEFESLFGALDANPLPASLEVMLRPNQSGAEAVEAVAARVRAFPFVEDVRYGHEWLDKVFVLRRVAGTATLILGAAFAIVAALIIGAAIRMSIYARRDEIAIMRLVGATEAFVRRPFLVEGVLTGVAGGLAALFATRIAFAIVSRSVFRIEWLPGSWSAGGIFAGILLGAVASAVAVHRHLREV